MLKHAMHFRAGSLIERRKVNRMPPELFAAIVPHGAWAIIAAILLYLYLQERKDNRLMSKALLESTREQVTATHQNTTATTSVAMAVNKLGEKLDTLITRRGR